MQRSPSTHDDLDELGGGRRSVSPEPFGLRVTRRLPPAEGLGRRAAREGPRAPRRDPREGAEIDALAERAALLARLASGTSKQLGESAMPRAGDPGMTRGADGRTRAKD